MEEYIIASGFDISEYVNASNRTYNCKVTNGIGIKKNGYLELKNINCNNIYIILKKISGNGKFILKYNSAREERIVYNTDKIYITDANNIRIERPSDATGDISILQVGFSIENTVSNLLKELNKCKYGRIKIVGDKIIANPDGFLEGFFPGDEIETIPEKCYVFQGNRITFKVQCLITKLKINRNHVSRASSIAKNIQQDIKDTKKMTMLDTANQADIVEKPLQQIPKPIKSVPRKAIYNSNDSKFANINRKFGGYKLYNNKQNKILSIYAASEVQIPFNTSGSTYYCIEVSARSGTRSFFQFYVGIDSGILQKHTIKCSRTLNTYKFYLNINKINSVRLGLETI